METRLQLHPIGTVQTGGKAFCLRIDEKYRPALVGLKGFSHLQVLWWAHQTDSPHARETVSVANLFKKGPEHLGIFATRAPGRPNPVMVSTINVIKIDGETGIIETTFIDAVDGTPLLDIKPYYPMQRARSPRVPAWCRHWPLWQEEAAAFNWQDEINFE